MDWFSICCCWPAAGAMGSTVHATQACCVLWTSAVAAVAAAVAVAVVVAECKDTPNMEIVSCLQKQHNMSHMGCTLWTPGCVSGYAAVCCTAVRHRTAGMMRYNGSTSVILAFHQQLDISLRWAQVCSGLLSGEVLPQTVAVRPSDSGAATGCACHTSSSTRSSTRGSNISSTATGGNGSWGAA